MSKQLTSILLVNYNGAIFLKDCIESIHKSFQSLLYEIVLLDNASSDNSLQIIEENFPEVILIKSPENLGFSKGNNIAFHKAKGKNILLLNTDTILLSPMQEVVDFLENNPETGVVGIKMVDKNGNYRKSAGHFPSPLRLLQLKRLYLSQNGFADGNFDKTTKSLKADWIEGSFLLTSRSNWEQVGGLDEDYFMYIEDMDFCKKVSLLNKNNVYLPNFQYIHYGGFNHSKEHLLRAGLIRYSNKFFSGITKKFAIIAVKLNHALKKKYAKKTTS